MQIDGAGNRKTLTNDSRALLASAEPCGKKYLVATWAFHGDANEPEVWRLSVDGAAPLQLTSGAANFRPFCSPDGKWVYYSERVTNRIMRVSVNGGRLEVVPGSEIPNEFFGAPPVTLSPDGKRMPFVVGVPPAQTRIRMVTLDAGPHPPTSTLIPDPRSSGSFVRFTPDGKSLAYAILENGVENLWVQPLDGSPGKQITNFRTESVSDFRWSPDGKTLGLVRVNTQSDIVLLHDRTNP
jgi:Tol biopolymer transport system component